MKRNRREKAQAFTELLAGLLGLMMLFVGLLLVALYTRENVESLISARGNADVAASEGGSGVSDAQSILEWSWGQDGIPFTTDDKPVAGNSSGQITRELASCMPESDVALDYRSMQSQRYFSSGIYLDEFLSSARLVSGASKVNQDAEDSLSGLKNAAGAFYGVQTSTLQGKEKVFMPERGYYVDSAEN